MKKLGLIVSIVGLILVGISLSIAISVVPSDVSGNVAFSMASLFEGMFDDIYDEILILPGDSTFVSYSTLSSNVPLLWGIQIDEYQSGDKLSIRISNIFGDDYGEFIQDEPIIFEVLEVTQSDILNFEIQNLGSRNVSIIVMFSEDPENSDALSNPDSPVMNMILTLTISGVLLILGIIISIVGIIMTLLDWKNNQINRRNY